MNNEEIQLFIRALWEAEFSALGPSLRLRVKYRDDASIYDEWPPVGLESILDTGIRDPGFGSGPVSYSDIEQISVLSSTSNALNSDEYEKKFRFLVGLVSSMPCVQISLEEVTLKLRA